MSGAAAAASSKNRRLERVALDLHQSRHPLVEGVQG